MPRRRPSPPHRPRVRFHAHDAPKRDPLVALCREMYAEGYAQGRQDAAATQQTDFEQALHHAKLDAMKELAYGASHEINNPLANIALRAQTLLKREDEPDKRKALEAMHRAAMRAHEMISDLMLFARPPALVCESLSLRSAAQQVIETMATRANERGVSIVLLPGADPHAWADATQVRVALQSLIDNSFEAIHDGGEIALKVFQEGPQHIVIEVRDNGPGIPKAILPHVFDPFFSGREAGRGLGFGLSKCWRIATEHGGTIDLQSEPGQGVKVLLRLPVSQEVVCDHLANELEHVELA